MMHSVSYHVDGGMMASRPVLLARLLMVPLLALILLAWGLWQLLLWPLRALLLFLRHERDTGTWEHIRQAVEFCSNHTAFLLMLSDRWPSGAVRVRLSYTPLVSRLEILIRPLLGLLLLLNAAVVGALLLPVWFLQVAHILLKGRRQPVLQRLLLNYLGFLIDARAYLLMGVEERPPLFPANMGWFLKSWKWLPSRR
ncbi:Uncharacterised protein [uncultured archaeon]|nr:Uncharacterised protein [uncultured archaeon]